ncbi:hypothetical protein IJ472_06770 [bacterium]|nr:hypothetical protein [bacterium]
MAVSRSEVYQEFTPEFAENWFDLKQKKYLFNYDNLYYSVFLDEDIHSDVVSIGIGSLLLDLKKLKEHFSSKLDPPQYGIYDYYPFGYKFYNNTLSYNEEFDILLTNNIPNRSTPRIVVQIRSRCIWQRGYVGAFEYSLKHLLELLKEFEIDVFKIGVNRIDYAFHTNCIQNMEKLFDRPHLVKHCVTNTRIYNAVGDPQNEWSIDYFSVGSRKSNSVFFRSYNKTREVVEQAYKSFFIDKWHKEGLISAYDKWCLEQAYQKASYDVGILIARIDWYLQFGKDEDLKNTILKLKTKYYAKNSNSTQIKKKIDPAWIEDDNKVINRVLPPVTMIVNFEFETHRTFYDSFANSMDNAVVTTEYDCLRTYILKVYECRKSFIRYLTSKGGTIAFVADKSIKPKDFTEEHYMDFWQRLRRVDVGTDFEPELSREYVRNIDVEKLLRRIVSGISSLSAISKPANSDDLDIDFSDLVSYLNDNHKQKGSFVPVDVDTGLMAKIKYGDYSTIKDRKNRQYRTLVPSSPQNDEQK